MFSLQNWQTSHLRPEQTMRIQLDRAISLSELLVHHLLPILGHRYLDMTCGRGKVSPARCWGRCQSSQRTYPLDLHWRPRRWTWWCSCWMSLASRQCSQTMMSHRTCNLRTQVDWLATDTAADENDWVWGAHSEIAWAPCHDAHVRGMLV